MRDVHEMLLRRFLSDCERSTSITDINIAAGEARQLLDDWRVRVDEIERELRLKEPALTSA